MDPAILEMLLSKGANVNGPDHVQLWTPLLVAIETGRISTVRILLQYGVDVNRKAYDGETPLMMAKATKNPTILKMLKQAGAKE